MSRRTRTQTNIDTINAYVTRVSQAFGGNSAQAVEVQNWLRPFDTYTNKQGVTVIRNTKENRAQYQKIAALKKKARQNSVYNMKKTLRQQLSAETGTPQQYITDEDLKDFATAQANYNELREQIYNLAQEFEDEGVTIDNNQLSQMFEDSAYYGQMRTTLEELRTMNAPAAPPPVVEENTDIDGYESINGFKNSDFFD